MTRKKQIIIPIVILIAGFLIFFAFSSMKKPPQEKEEVDNTPIVAVEAISLKPMTLDVDSYGVVKPKYETELVAQVSGQIVELSATFVRGGFVKEGQLLARIDPNDYEAALIEAEATMASARASLETERAQGQVAKQEWQQITDTSPTELSLRKPQLAQEIARVKSAQASILRAKRNLERTEVRAPYDAMIDSRNVGLGSFVGTGSMLGKLLGTAIAEVRLPVADNQLEFLIEQGQNATVNLSGTFAGSEVTWPAKIARSEGVIDSTSRMSYLVAEIFDPYALLDENSKTPLRFGSYVNANILGVAIEQAASIPRYLVANSQVALLDSESKLHYSAVKIVRQDGQNVIISSGLADGDQLIVSALDYPVDGMKLALISDKSQQESEEDLDDQESESQVAKNDSGSGE
ncbi:efflux RND transporter periplasmic adaptor subunit [Cognaticolwellia beringensis]|uniref:Efflux transporter periplasmic adaptor subunit n=1 Tax=Cognaticolwellia beringensis TaxID=1967665 RepID=A0A222G409_9GAMM|nr:efflux RND transporter periplasmic adaptor subunit [Cognaticolwellia beringensis]ASP46333.1 efflux transporter periplasmic adaptor subunit [Cognaticolwellia beringensis]